MPLLIRLLVSLATAGTLVAGAEMTASASESAPPPVANVDVRTKTTSSAATFDRAYLIKTSRYVIRDMKTINSRLRDGIAVSSALYLLSGSYGYMSNAGVPPKIVKKNAYRARIATLSDFAELAADEYYDDEIAALARYSVIQQQTRILFKQINAAIGTSLTVPR
jgi:hypothetical protein